MVVPGAADNSVPGRPVGPDVHASRRDKNEPEAGAANKLTFTEPQILTILMQGGRGCLCLTSAASMESATRPIFPMSRQE